MSTDPTTVPDTVVPWSPSRYRASTASTARPEPMQSLVASAKRLTGKQMETHLRGIRKTSEWQQDAWDMFDLVGEQRFLVTTLAHRMSQAHFYVGKIDGSGDTPEPVDDEQTTAILDAVGGGRTGRAQMIYRMGVNLGIAGDGWLAGIPKDMLKDHATEPDTAGPGYETTGTGRLHLDDLDWRMLSVGEVSRRSDKVQITLGDGPNDQLIVDPDDVYLIRVWRPHPRQAWNADSPTRASLPVLRELVGLTMHVSAQVDSRLAGAGMLVVPQSADEALRQQAGEDSEDPFSEALAEAMTVPIGDRASASAVVPLTVTVPDEAAEKFQYMSFDTPLDGEARELREEAIRRLALGQDAPPELLLGTAGSSHWGAWLVQEDVVTTHVEPPLALICDALTTQYLRPVLIEQGMSEEEASQHVVWYDVNHLIIHPNRGDEAMNLYNSGVISEDALRRELGFDDEDAPPDVAPEGSPDEVVMAMSMVKKNPGLLSNPGLPSIVAQIRAVLRSNGHGLSVDPIGDPSADETGDGDPTTVDTAEPDVPSRAQPAGSPGGRKTGPAAASRNAVPVGGPGKADLE